jgi:two-component system, NtrC family, sensor kinase
MNQGNQRILVIDDNRAIHEDFRKVLSPAQKAADNFEAAEAALLGEEPAAETDGICRQRFEIESAYQGKDGLAMVAAALQRGEPYAMAFVDVRMPPGWDGIETTAKIWEIDPDLQIVICTAYSDYSWGEMQKKLGQSDRLVILKKPFDRIEVAQLASSLTRKWQLQHESNRRLGDLEAMVVARTAEVVREQDMVRSIFDNSPEGIFQTNQEGRFIAANPALTAIYGYASPRELMEQLTDADAQLYVEPGRRAEWQRRIGQEKVVRGFESEIKCKDGTRKWISETACCVNNEDGSLRYYQGFVVDITAQKKARQERSLMEVHLRQAQKLESVGQLAAGIAHEINTPIQYIGDNIRFVEESFVGLNQLLADYHCLVSAAHANQITPELLARVDAASQRVDVAYLSKEIPLAVHQSLDGVKHVAKIVLAMKEFSHPGAVEKVATDLNHAIETTLIVARNEWKYIADVVTDFDPSLPKTPCVPGEFNQVILNLIVNAAHAIKDVVQKVENAKGTIRITTRQEADSVCIDISDTGGGIPVEVRHRIFEPFFTTKEVGKGTGQGLAMARSTIVSKHGGQLTFASTVGVGTTFTIRLPLGSARSASAKNPLAPAGKNLIPVCDTGFFVREEPAIH